MRQNIIFERRTLKVGFKSYAEKIGHVFQRQSANDFQSARRIYPA